MRRGIIGIAGMVGIALTAACAVALSGPRAWAIEIRKAGSIEVPAGVAVVPYSTDPLVAQTLRQDFEAENRGADAKTPSPVTLSVSVNQRPLRPGVSLQDLAPGDPDVAKLIKAAGGHPPPLGDTGTAVDEAALARARAQNDMLPAGATPMQSLLNEIQTHGDLGPPLADPSGCVPGTPCVTGGSGLAPQPDPGSPKYTGDTQDYMTQGYESNARRMGRAAPGRDFDNVIVARVSISGSPGEMTVVALTHPGEDLDDAKKLIAEEIANSVLH